MKEDIEDAIHAHGVWKAKFRDFLSGKTALDLSTVGETNCCKLGQWLEQEACRLLPQTDRDDICKLHAEFHHVAAEITRKIKQKDFVGARSDLAPDGAFNQASHALATCLLKAELHASPQSVQPAPSVGEAGKTAQAASASTPSGADSEKAATE